MIITKIIFLAKIIAVSLFITLVISVEPLYRWNLFDLSIILIKQFQTATDKSLIQLSTVILNLATYGIFVPVLVFVFLFAPLNISYTFTSVILYAIYFDNVFKLIYTNPRPYWVDPTIALSCESGYGNPSGHAMLASTLYLTAWHFLTNFLNFRNTRMKLIMFFVYLLVVLLIMISTIYLGIHSINQALYGALLGVGLYYVHLKILNVHEMRSKAFFAFFRNKKVMVFFILLHLFCIALLITVYCITNPDITPWMRNIKRACTNVELYRSFNNEALLGGLVILAIMGTHYGVTVLAVKFNQEYPEKEISLNRWNLTSWKNSILKLLLFIPFTFPMILFLVIPGDIDIALIFLFKITIPYLLTSFLCYFCYVYACLKFGIANSDIYFDSEKHAFGINNTQLDMLE
jgi:membrane-associated phospholipid phosphatase